MIRIEKVKKVFGTEEIIREIGFEIQTGEIVGLLGPNGAGKTTIMRMLAGYLAPSTGNISIDGFNLQEQPLEARKRIGYLPETVPLYKELSVFSFLKILGTIRGINGKQLKERIQETMTICRIEEMRNRKIKHLSKGYRQLVGIAQAILHKPGFIILDEPTNGIDARQVVQIRQMIRNLEQGHAILFSSHNLSEVASICQKILIIDKGRIVAMDTKEALSKRIDAARLFEIEVHACTRDLRQKLETLENIERIETKDSEKSCLITVQCRNEVEDTRSRLIEAVTADGHNFIGLRVLEPSLEDVFLKLTTENIKVIREKESA